MKAFNPHALGAKIAEDDQPKGFDPYERGAKEYKVDTILGEMPEPKQFLSQLKDPHIIDQMIRSAAFGGSGPIAGMAKPIQQFGGSVFNYPAFGKPIAEGINKVADKIPVIGKAVNELIGQSPKLQKAINLLEYPIKGGMAGAAQNPENPLQGGLVGGTVATVLPPAFKVAGKIAGTAFNALRPSVFLRGTQTPEELQRALDVTTGTQTPLGSVLQSPILKGTQENILANVPGSGVYPKMQQIRNDIIEKGHGLLDELLGSHNAENVEGQIHGALGSVAKMHTKLKRQLYDAVDDLADESGLKLELPTFAKVAQKFKDVIEDTNILKTEPEVKGLLARLGRYTEPVTKTEGKIISTEGKPLVTETKHPRLKEANILKGKLGTMANNYLSSSSPQDRQIGSVIKQLHTAIRGDIKSELIAHGDKKLIDAYTHAENNYATNFSGFLDKEINNFINGKTDADTVMQTFIKTGAADRAILLNKLAEKLPADKRRLLGYAYLKQALDENGKIDPIKLRQLISIRKLGARQFQALFPDKAFRQKLRNYSDLTTKNEAAFTTMVNPKTGAVVKSYIPIGMMAAGYNVAGVPGMIAAGVGGPLLAKGANALLTSPKVRESLVNKMIQNSIK